MTECKIRIPFALFRMAWRVYRTLCGIRDLRHQHGEGFMGHYQVHRTPLGIKINRTPQQRRIFRTHEE